MRTSMRVGSGEKEEEEEEADDEEAEEEADEEEAEEERRSRRRAPLMRARAEDYILGVLLCYGPAAPSTGQSNTISQTSWCKAPRAARVRQHTGGWLQVPRPRSPAADWAIADSLPAIITAQWCSEGGSLTRINNAMHFAKK